jgi:hypothetical protein
VYLRQNYYNIKVYMSHTWSRMLDITEYFLLEHVKASQWVFLSYIIKLFLVCLHHYFMTYNIPQMTSVKEIAEKEKIRRCRHLTLEHKSAGSWWRGVLHLPPPPFFLHVQILMTTSPSFHQPGYFLQRFIHFCGWFIFLRWKFSFY